MKAGKRLYGVVEGEVKEARKRMLKSSSVEDKVVIEKRKKRIAERDRLKGLTDKIKGKNCQLRQTSKKMMSMRLAKARSVGATLSMAETAANVRILMEKGDAYKPGNKEVDKGVIRVRNSILTTNLKEKEKQQAHFMKIFEKNTPNVIVKAKVTPATSKKDGGAKLKRRHRKSLKGDMPTLPPRKKKEEKVEKRATNILECISSQPNAPLHYGMEVGIQAATPPGEEEMFLACMHPDGDTKVLPASKVRGCHIIVC